MNLQQLTIKRSQVPVYLHASELYQSVDGEEDDEITIPGDCLKPDFDIIYISDLDHLFRTVRFWVLRPYPNAVLHSFVHDYGLEMDEMLDHYEDEKQLQLFLRKLQQFPENLRTNLAAKHGQVEFLVYFVRMTRSGFPITTSALQEAAKNGHLDCLQYIFCRLKSEELRNCISPRLWRDMIRFGHASCIAFLLSAKKVLLPTYIKKEGVSAMTYATRCDQVECLKVFFHHAIKAEKEGDLKEPLGRCEVSTKTWAAAMATKNSPCFQFLVASCPWQVQSDSILLLLACKAGNVTAMRVLCAQGCPVPADIIVQAVRGGSYQCVRFLHDELHLDCWTPSTMATAAAAGHLQLVQRLHEEGCPWDQSAPLAALHHSRAETLDFLIQQRGVPKCDKFRAAGAYASVQCQIVIFHWQIHSLVGRYGSEPK